jgi:hypothetical protein
MSQGVSLLRVEPSSTARLAMTLTDRMFVAAAALPLILSLTACGGGGGADAAPSGPTTSSATPSLVRWSGNANAEAISDGRGSWFAVSAQSRQIGFVGSAEEGPVYLTTPLWLLNTRVDSEANLTISGIRVGGVFSERDAAGRSTAVLRCTDGSPLVLAATNGVASHVCLTAGAGSGGTGGGTGAGGGGGSGAVGGPMPGGGGAGTALRFITFNGSANGICVLDASNDCFAVDDAGFRVSFIGPLAQVVNVLDIQARPAATYTNTRVLLRDGALDALTVDGSVVASLRSIRLVNGQMGVGFLCNGDRFYLDIYADPARPGSALHRCTDRAAPR